MKIRYTWSGVSDAGCRVSINGVVDMPELDNIITGRVVEDVSDAVKLNTITCADITFHEDRQTKEVKNYE